MNQDTTVPLESAENPPGEGNVLSIQWASPGGDGGLITSLASRVTLVGRDPACDVQLPSAQVSRRHAEIRLLGGATMIYDLGSVNGVFLNLRRLVNQAPLRPRDVLRLGDWVGVVTYLPPDTPATWRLEEVIPGYWAGPALLPVLAPARRAAVSDLPVIIEGETGAGKEGAARAVHAWSGRSGPFLGLNCAALPEALAEGELFGYRKGAFTGADRMSPGHLRSAHGGTLFLDEIVDLSLPVQGKLLRAIEEREVHPIGEPRPVAIDTRLLAATQAPLRQAVEEKRLRPDLFARLDGFTIKLPPLRDRIAEAPALFCKLLEQLGAMESPRRLDPLLVERLCFHDWPFNVRELALLARQLLALYPNAATLDRSMLPERLRFEPAPPVPEDQVPGAQTTKRGGERQQPDASAFLTALRENAGNVKKTAAALGVSRSRAYRLMEQIDSIDLGAIRRETSPRGSGKS